MDKTWLALPAVVGLFVVWHLAAGWAQRRIDRVEQRRRAAWQVPAPPAVEAARPMPAPPPPTSVRPAPRRTAQRDAAESGLH